MSAVDVIHGVTGHLASSVGRDLDDLFDFSDNVWFWREIVKRDLLRFLEFAIEPTLISTAENLLYAYTYSGTMEGIIRLSQGLFGRQSIIIVDDSTPAVIDIEVKNANANFLYALGQKNYTLALEERFAAATADLAAVVSYDPLQFFRNFLTPGRVLRSLNISQGGN